MAPAPLKKIFTREGTAGFLLVLLLFFLSLWLHGLPGLQKLELGLTDSRIRTYRDKFQLKDSPIVVVDIDDDSYDALFAVWPWPRSYYARLIRNLNRAGAKFIAIDIMLDKARIDYPEQDDSLALALKEFDNVILAGKILYENNMEQAVPPYEKFLNQEKDNWGLIDIAEDMDGTIRDYFLGRGMIMDSSYYASLAVKIFEQVTGRKATMNTNPFRIAFPGGRKTFLYRPFYQVVDDATLWTRDEKEWDEENNWYDTLLTENVFQDKIVLVGASMEELHDNKPTPFSADAKKGISISVPGVEIHAAALHTLLNDYRIHDVEPWIIYLALAIGCFLIFIIGQTTRIWIYLPVVAALAAGWFWGGFKLYEIGSILIPIASPLLTVFMVSAGQQGYFFYLEQLKRRQVTGMFGQYVPKEVVKELISDPKKMKLGGERRELTTLFSDVAGFTTISEKLTPEQLVELLNEYLTAMTEIVHENGGIIDKYEGDAIMAEFGIPLILPDHAERACRTAFSMQKRLHELRDKWAAEGKPGLTARVGIGSGDMVFGNMGSNQSFDYTVMGDVVNLSSRLEGANKNYGTKILINERTYELAKGSFFSREMDLLQVKGKSLPVKCFHLMASHDSAKANVIKQVIDVFSKGVSLYRAQKWEKAIDQFNQVLAIWNDDQPSQVYVQRCRDFMQAPPPNDWDGVFVMTTK